MSEHDSSRIVITAMGATTPVGGDAEKTNAAISAGMNVFTEHAYFCGIPDDPDWDEDLPIYAATVPLIDPFLGGIERFNQLAIPSIAQVFSGSGIKRSSLSTTGLFIALPKIDPSIQNLPLDDSWLAELRRQMGLGSLGAAKVSNDAHVGVFALVNEAVELLRSGQLKQCIVGGVDSYLLEERISFLDNLWRVKSSRNVDGFVPGEAAVMLMLETKANALARGAKPLAELGNIGFGLEPSHFFSDKSSSGQGLTDVIKLALHEQPASESSVVFCDLNGESYYGYEWGLVNTRLGQLLGNVAELHHPADCCGDIGSVSGALLLANAAGYLSHEDSNMNSALLFTANDDGRRSALVLKRI